MTSRRANHRLFLTSAAALIVWLAFGGPATTPAADPPGDYLQVTGPCGLSFPRDHGPHPGFRTEWWYYTGNLEAENGRRFGFQLTFFRHQLSPLKVPDDRPEPQSAWRTHQVYLAHAAVADLSGRRHLQSGRASREALGMAGAVPEENGVTVFVGDWNAAILPGLHRLAAASHAFALQLDLVPAKDPVRHGIQGYSRKGSAPERASCYYSMTRLDAAGTLRLENQPPMAVEGSAWMDHEFSTAPLEPGTVGWDWFGIQLDDRSELMMFLLRREQGDIHPISSGTYVDPQGVAHHLERGHFAVEVLDTWKSGRSGAVYPSKWKVKVPPAGIDIVVTPNLPDQEMHLDDVSGITYWEGSVAARGTKGKAGVEGLGYVELTGYAGPFGALK